MRKITVVVFLVLLTAAVSAAYEMPYCGCIDLYYNPQGPTLPNSFSGEQVSGIHNGARGVVAEFDIDIGNLPYSVPGYGWYSKPSATSAVVVANIYSTVLGMNVKLKYLDCCGVVQFPLDPIFQGYGVIMEWNSYNRAYIGSAGGNTYVAVPFDSNGTTYITLFEVMYAADGSLYAFVTYEIVIPPEAAGPRDSPSRRMEDQ